MQALEDFLTGLFRKDLDVPLEDKHSDFFASGLDSLKALRIVGVIKRRVNLGGNGAHLTQNEIYQKHNVSTLAEYLCDLRKGNVDFSAEKPSELEVLQELAEKYSSFAEHKPVPGNTDSARTVVVKLRSLRVPRAEFVFRYSLVQRVHLDRTYSLVLYQGGTSKRCTACSEARQMKKQTKGLHPCSIRDEYD